ncbi:NUDIX hydrolase [Sphingomonas parva]|uniref:NUDIX hydrolase n=1 Tax=Sphingomonas parva TaxID=2555898 RepID=UPI001CDD133F|nr:NUDIX hydrolase [Sphingomonas parva]
MAVQFGVVPVRIAEGEVRILLVTSRDTRRWVVPRGNPIPNLSPEQTAAQEAFEEAGVRGSVRSPPLGSYRYDKRKRSGVVVPTEVRLFTMMVEEELDSWPERNQRERRWFAPDEAADAVHEADLKLLLRGVEAPLC